MRRSSLIWGVILLLLGGLMFVDATGLRLPGGARPMEFFWPLLLILLGGWLILAVFLRGVNAPESEQATVSLQGASEARVRISHGAGKFNLSSGAGSGDLVNGTFMGGLRQSAHLNGSRLEVALSPAPTDWLSSLGSFRRYDWAVHFNPDIPMTLKLEMGANKSRVDLSDLRVTDLKLETGASDTRVILPKQGRLRADFDLGAASLDVTVPDGVAARIRVNQGVSDVKVNQSRFPRSGNFYQSPDFDSAANSVDITIDAGAAGITVR